MAGEKGNLRIAAGCEYAAADVAKGTSSADAYAYDLTFHG
jgi:hypothetical protein